MVKYVKQYSRSFYKTSYEEKVVKMINIMTTEDEKKTALATSYLHLKLKKHGKISYRKPSV